jgi:aromatic ring-opening dioxygenase LigB subunit
LLEELLLEVAKEDKSFLGNLKEVKQLREQIKELENKNISKKAFDIFKKYQTRYYLGDMSLLKLKFFSRKDKKIIIIFLSKFIGSLDSLFLSFKRRLQSKK